VGARPTASHASDQARPLVGLERTPRTKTRSVRTQSSLAFTPEGAQVTNQADV
jgi:hypothetical protein